MRSTNLKFIIKNKYRYGNLLCDCITSINYLCTSTDIKLTISPVVESLRALLDNRRDFLYMALIRAVDTLIPTVDISWVYCENIRLCITLDRKRRLAYKYPFHIYSSLPTNDINRLETQKRKTTKIKHILNNSTKTINMKRNYPSKNGDKNANRSGMNFSIEAYKILHPKDFQSAGNILAWLIEFSFSIRVYSDD